MKNGPVFKIGPGEEFPDTTPKQYLQGWVEFYKLKFKVTPDVLIPRPETELLVDEVLSFILRPSEASGEVQNLGSSPFQSNNNITLLDVGTGSGNIAISLAKNLPKAKIFATDVSESALNVARENARKHRVEKRFFFIKSDLLSAFVIPSERSSRGNLDLNKIATSPSAPRNDRVDIIVTNLPYIPSARIPYLDPLVKDFEPRIALDGGPDGFDLYRKLFQQIKEKFLTIPVISSETRNPCLAGRQVKISRKSRDRGYARDDRLLKLIVCEIDYTQGELAVQEALKYFPDASIDVKTDLAKKQRILIIRF